MSDEQILFLYKALKCQGENGFAGHAFALTSASGILLKRTPRGRSAAQGERGAAPAARLGAARQLRDCGISVQASADEFAPRGGSERVASSSYPLGFHAQEGLSFRQN